MDGVVSELAPLPGHGYSYASAVNDDHVAVGTSAPVAPGSPGYMVANQRAVRWDATGAITDLGTLGGDRSFATDINRHGVIVGTSDIASGSSTRPFVFDPAVGSMVALPNPPGATATAAVAIDDDGRVIGRATYLFEGFYTDGTPVMWDLATGTVTKLGATTGLDVALDSNAAGVIAGAVEWVGINGEHALVPALWFPGEGLVYPRLDPPGSSTPASSEGTATTSAIIMPWLSYARVLAVNDRGEAIVAGTLEPGGPAGSYRWTREGGLVPADPGVELLALNDTGVFAGADGGHAAFVLPDP